MSTASTPEPQSTTQASSPDREWPALHLALLGLAILGSFLVFIYFVSP
jgi:hypothetical protein